MFPSLPFVGKGHSRRRSCFVLGSALAFAALACLTAAPAHAQFLDLTALTPGTSGTFSGTLGGVALTGAITANDSSYSFNPTGSNGFLDSTTNNTSMQYNYANVYRPTQALTDQVGYTKVGSPGSATITIAFASAVTNPVFHVANLDASQDIFSLTGGLTGLTLLSGNGGGDGLALSGTTIYDLDTTTVIAYPTTSPPPTTGPRSGYGSVQLLGAITILTFVSSSPSGGSDGGNFTLSTAPAAVPEPGSIALFIGLGASSADFLVRRRKQARIAA